MLTSLDFLNLGERFPPECEKDRLTMYCNNKRLFEADHAEVYEKDLKRIERVIGNFEQVISYPVILNFQKLLSLKIVDLLFGEPPIISCGEKDSPEQICIDNIIETSDLFNTASMLGIDVSRYGDGLFHVRQEEGHGLIDLAQPTMWFPVVDPTNVRKKTAHVIAWTTEAKDLFDNKISKLYVQIHTPGWIESREYTLDGGYIKTMTSSTMQSTGLTLNDIIEVPNIMTSDRVTGFDDYTDIDSIVAEMIVRVGQISRILDKHASPSMQGPKSALEQDPRTHEWRLKAGNYFPRDSMDDPEVAYLTWEGQLEANFKILEKLLNMLYTISEMGSALFGDMTANPGQVPSGSALRRLMISPLAKVKRIKMRLDRALKTALTLCSQLGGEGIVSLDGKQITITWQDGLPGDPVEDADVMSKRVAGKATMSQYRALQMFDGMSNEEADEELGRIQLEDEIANPMPESPVNEIPNGEE